MQAQDYISALNPEQRDAVVTTRGPVLILAGAGSGKTRVITHRIAYLLAQGVMPSEILAVTFTNKAAAEMKERVGALTGGTRINDLWISTFHSLGLKLLRKEASHLGQNPSSTILDEEDRAAIVREVLSENNTRGTDIDKDAFYLFLQRIKGEGAEPMTAAQAEGPLKGKILLRMFRHYQKRLSICTAWDFDDLIWLTVKLLAENEKVRTRYAQRFRFIMVDEYQDTNNLQFQLLKHLASAHGNICVVGDDDQSIYGWRGARIENILEFERLFPGAKVVKLTRNYRSSQSIIGIANNLIKNNQKRHDKALWTDIPDSFSIEQTEVKNPEEEAGHVCACIRDLIAQGERPDQIAVLYRTKGQARAFEEALTVSSVPYRVIGSFDFFSLKEVRDTLAYLKIIVNHNDDPSLVRVVNYPPRGIGSTTLSLADARKKAEGLSLFKALKLLGQDQTSSVSPKTRKGVERFIALVERFSIRLRSTSPEQLPGLARDLMSESGVEEHLVANKPQGWRTIEIIIEMIERTIRRNHLATLGEFLEMVTLDDRSPEDEQGLARVSLITMHAAKGLEFKHVFVVGLVEGIMPHQRSMYDQEGLEEERRLMYVALTRARQHLILTGFRARKKPRGDVITCIPSRFLKELPANLLQKKSPEINRELTEDELSDTFDQFLSLLSD